MSGRHQLGINGLFHDAAVCLLRDGVPVMMVEEERLDRVKHSSGFPERGIELCLATAGIGLGDVSDVAFSWRPARMVRHQVRVALANLPASLGLIAPGASEIGVARKLRLLFGLRSYLARRFGADPRAFRLHMVGHHVAHAYDSYAFSPYDEAAVLVIDGFGEVASTSLFVVSPRGIRHVRSIPYPHSLGIVYGALTEFLGFRPMHDEYKVMGLSAYGEDRYRAAFDRLLAADGDGGYRVDLSYLAFHTRGRNQWFAPSLTTLLGAPRRPDEPVTDRHRDIACSLQRAVERRGLELARAAARVTGLPNLCLSGGVAQNVCLNACIVEDGAFRGVFVPPAPSDAGTAHGAIQAVRARTPGVREAPVAHAYLGPAYSRAECAAALARHGLRAVDVGEDTRALVRELANGRMVGICQGRMEFGPRALGGRSILADPRRVEARDRLNATIKRREEFRPFAPAVPEERAAEFFSWETPSPFMSFVARVRPGQERVIPAVVHVDGTARVQTVRREDNPFFWRLLTDFGALTGVPVLLNTSFNENEPIVCTPDEAIACFLRTPLDVLYVEGFLVTKEATIAASA